MKSELTLRTPVRQLRRSELTDSIYLRSWVLVKQVLTFTVVSRKHWTRYWMVLRIVTVECGTISLRVGPTEQTLLSISNRFNRPSLIFPSPRLLHLTRSMLAAILLTR